MLFNRRPFNYRSLSLVLLFFMFWSPWASAQSLSCGTPHAFLNRARSALVKSHMSALRTHLEIYAVDYDDQYPATLVELEKEVPSLLDKQAYPNPYDPSLPSFISLEDYLSRSAKPQGVVIYEALIPAKSQMVKEVLKATGYRIYGTNAQGLLLRDPENTEVPFRFEKAPDKVPTLLLPYLEPLACK